MTSEHDPQSDASTDRYDEPVTFADLNLRPELQRALEVLGYEEPTPIQREAIPPMLAGRDLLGQAATGTGKTAAFALPVLNGLDGPPGRRVGPSAVILVPTRELAIQVSEAIHRYGRELGARVLPIYGGQPIGRQIRELERGVDVVVATPGRALDHLSRGTLSLDHIRVVVLDEADEMLDMGFAEDIEAILDQAPSERQTVLFSATMPARLNGIVKQHLNDPVRVQIRRENVSSGDSPRVRQTAYLVRREHKASALGRLLDVEAPVATIVFCRTREEVDTLAETLNARGYRAEALHGGMTQDQRDRVMGRLRSGSAELLVATDVAARGLDIEQLTHVVNYDVPSAPESYVHRVGRVGRAGREGTAITLVEPRQHRLLKQIEKVTRHTIAVEKVPTVADLQARRLEITRSSLHETLVEDDSERYRGIVEGLADDYDLMEIALAAVKLAHEANGAFDADDDIPEVKAFREPTGERDFKADGKKFKPRDNAESRPAHGKDGKDGRSGDRLDRPDRLRGDITKIFVALGRAAKVRPQDLTGAIAGETSLSGRQIGAIEIADRFSTVEIPTAAVDEVISKLKATKIKGRKVHAEVYKPRGH